MRLGASQEVSRTPPKLSAPERTLKLRFVQDNDTSADIDRYLKGESSLQLTIFSYATGSFSLYYSSAPSPCLHTPHPLTPSAPFAHGPL